MVVILFVSNESEQVREELGVVLSKFLQFVDQAGVELPLPAELADVLVLLAYLVEADYQLLGVLWAG